MQYGQRTGRLSVPPTNRFRCNNQPVATVRDNIANANILPFGMCQSPTNPQVAAATAAAGGTLTPQPCLPVTPAPWAPGATSMNVAGAKALTKRCRCNCQWGGVISVDAPGQSNTFTASSAPAIPSTANTAQGRGENGAQSTSDSPSVRARNLTAGATAGATQQDWIGIKLTNGFDEPVDGQPFVLHLANGRQREGKLDGQGLARLYDVPSGEITIEFPGIFSVVSVDGRCQLDGPQRGKPISARPQLPEPSYSLNAGDVEVHPDSDDFHDYAQDEVKQHTEAFSIGEIRTTTGRECHLAILHCLYVRLLRPDGRWYRDPVDYHVKNARGDVVAQGQAKDGVIFCDPIAMGRYTLTIDGESYTVSSSSDVSDFECVHLR